MFSFLRRRECQILSVLLLFQSVSLYGILQRHESIPVRKELAATPDQFAGWTKVQENVAEPEVLDVLKADDLLNRTYLSPDGSRTANLFVAYFQSQRSGKAPHSPKNCLPGSGWTPSVSDKLTINVPGRAEPMVVNRYLVQKGESRAVVLYWYQSVGRVIASEYTAKIYLVLDSIRHNRSDAALVRVVASVAGEDGVETATRTAQALAAASYEPLTAALP